MAIHGALGKGLRFVAFIRAAGLPWPPPAAPKRRYRAPDAFAAHGVAAATRDVAGAIFAPVGAVFAATAGARGRSSDGAPGAAPGAAA